MEPLHKRVDCSGAPVCDWKDVLSAKKLHPMVVRKEANTLMVISVDAFSRIWISCLSCRIIVLSGPSCNIAMVRKWKTIFRV